MPSDPQDKTTVALTVECVSCKTRRDIGAGETLSEPPTCETCLLPMVAVGAKSNG